MIKIKNRDNLYFEGMDPIDNHFHQRKIELLKKSWARVFRDHVLPKLPVKQIAKHFDKYMGRPTKELTAMCGACVLQQFFDLTDEETRDQLAFNQQWHYALDVLDEEDQIISLKTLWTCRQMLLKDNVSKKIFDSVTDKLADAYGVDPKLQRLDSVHIHSNMARLGRIRILSRTCTIFLKNLKRHHKKLYDDISETIKSRYAKNDEDPDYLFSDLEETLKVIDKQGDKEEKEVASMFLNEISDAVSEMEDSQPDEKEYETLEAEETSVESEPFIRNIFDDVDE